MVLENAQKEKKFFWLITNSKEPLCHFLHSKRHVEFKISDLETIKTFATLMTFTAGWESQVRAHQDVDLQQFFQLQ